MAEERGFLARWSQRKLSVEAGEPAPEPDELATEQAAAAAAAEAEAEANRIAAEAIDLEALGKDSDYTPFLKRGVPEALTRAALNRLWRSDPVLACVDGLNDYDQDFNAPGLGAVFRSAWEVGRGYVADAAETAADVGPPADKVTADSEPTVEADASATPDPATEGDATPPGSAPEPPARASQRHRLGLNRG